MSELPLQRTPLYEAHRSLGARLVPFAGFEMPVQYSGIIDEHMAVRRSAGLFDVSHMGEVWVTGPEAEAYVQYLTSNDVTRLYDGRAMYSVMCTDEGGIVDDLLVYRLGAQDFMCVINASNIEKDFAWMKAHNPMNASLENVSEAVALLALQGPNALPILQTITDEPVDTLRYYHFLQPEPENFLGCEHAVLSRTGYTGEFGFEIYCEAERAIDVWNAVLEAGAPHGLQPAGLGARDTLRLEAGYCLYGNDITEETNPLEAGLGWITKLDAGAFVGREALLPIKEAGPGRKLVAFVMNERGIPRQGYPILDTDGNEIGVVTSGTQSPVLSQGIGMGYVPNEPRYTSLGSGLLIGIRSRQLAATVKKPPLHKTD